MDAWENTLLTASDSLLEAVRVIDSGGVGAAFVVDDAQRLLGTVTDGDVRRALLRSKDMNTPVSSIMCTTPKTVSVGDSQEHIANLMRRYKLQHIPVLDEANRLVNIELLQQQVFSTVRDNWVVIMAGGLGTRLRPLTQDCPKPLLKVGEKPVLEIIIDQLKEYGFENIYLSVNYKAEMIKDYFRDGKEFSVNIRYLEESSPMGTAGALSLLPSKPDKPFFVMNGDILTRVNFSHLLNFHRQHRAKATVCVREYQHSVPYGVVKLRRNNLLAFEEKPTQKYFVNAGIYAFDPSVLDNIKPNTPLNMPELIEDLNQQRPLKVFPLREYWLDIGQHDDFEQAHHDVKELFNA